MPASLRGGTLLMTPLRGVDGEVYGIAQGSLVVSGFGVKGKDGSSCRSTCPPAAACPTAPRSSARCRTTSPQQPFVMLNLHTPDFTTAARLAAGINKLLGAGTAQAMDAVSVKVAAPVDPNQRIAYLSTLEAIEVEPGDAPARVIVNSRTGTVVIGSRVRVTPAAVAHGSLQVTITERPRREPARTRSRRARPWSRRAARSRWAQGQARMFLFDAGVNLDEIVRAVNQVGAAPSDLVAILEALKEAGALHAELIVI